MTKNWKDIHSDFTGILQAEWEDRNFTYEQVKEWIDIGLTPQDYDFCEWLSDEGYTALAVLNNGDQEQLKKDYQTSFILKRPLFEWYSDQKLTFNQFSLLSNKVPDKGANYSWKEISELLKKSPHPETNNYRVTKLLILAGAIVLIIILYNSK